MGQEIATSQFCEIDRDLFKKKLREETLLLKNWFDQRLFEYVDTPLLGLEIEAWLIDRDQIPLPKNDIFLKKAKSEDLVHELSQFNFEMNLHPHAFNEDCFEKFQKQIRSLWQLSMQTAEEMNASVMLIGILPMIRDEMLSLKYISDSNRYNALNEQLFMFRGGEPLDINIRGNDHLVLKKTNLMMEAAATSMQVHFQVNQENAKRVYNASQIVSAPLVALTANSPYLYGYDLWDESRIPVFEQSLMMKNFRDKKGEEVGRVTFGTGYLRRSMLELFIENLDAYSVLLPLVSETPKEELSHLKLQNGTIWRWNRPIVGFSGKKPHLRIEQRIMSSGPSIDDMVANMAFYVGLTSYFSEIQLIPEESMTFTDCKNNFYEAAKNGLSAKIKWFGKEVSIQELILNDLVKKTKEGLLKKGIYKDTVEYYIDNIIYKRCLTGQNGAHWQRAFVDCYGKNFQSMSEAYLENQSTEKPIHLWKL